MLFLSEPETAGGHEGRMQPVLEKNPGRAAPWGSLCGVKREGMFLSCARRKSEALAH